MWVVLLFPEMNGEQFIMIRSCEGRDRHELRERGWEKEGERKRERERERERARARVRERWRERVGEGESE